jgi:hypothetical protein
MELNFKSIIFTGVLILCPAAFGQNTLIRASDTLHFDIREAVNFGSKPRTVAVGVDLCAALKQDSSVKGKARVFCKAIDESTGIDIEGRGTDQKFSAKRFPDGVQSKRRTQSEVQATALSILETMESELNTGRSIEVSQVDFRIRVRFFSLSRSGNEKDGFTSGEDLDTQFTALPSIEMEAPASERGLLINRLEVFSADRILKARVLIVITRRGPKA